ncbi:MULTISPECIES: hypothetical protein [Roseomonadaceae]|uniref:Cyclic di-GMP-binding protein n=1 Tax=Falsiroseomonas oleicola TaxID=2801474 RepID=A0ABS6HC82_9PROT|nr:hypothetical protein [Roseomonas oleicola]MBU8545961.1 hypothetical protein [Roseomonas oleicola]
MRALSHLPRRLCLATGLLLSGGLAQAQPLPLPPPPAPALAQPAPIQAQPLLAPLIPAVPAPRPATPLSAGQGLQRRIGLPELGLAEGLGFDAGGQALDIPLPRGVPELGARVHLAIDLAAPFPGRHAVELRLRDQILASTPFPEGERRLLLNIPLPDAALAGPEDRLRLDLRLLSEAPGAPARATLLPESHLTLLLPDSPEISVAALFRLLPPDTRVLLRPGPISAAEAAAALRIGLALAASGRDARISSAPPGLPLPAQGGARLWTRGAVLVGDGAEAASVRLVHGLPVLVLGGAAPERLARLLDSPWRDLALAGTLSGGVAPEPASAPAAATLSFDHLRGSLAPQDQAQARWALEFASRDLPAGLRPEALEVALRATPDPGGRPAVATVLLNQVILGGGALDAQGVGRLALPLPPGLLAADNRIEVLLNRASAAGPAQLLPSSLLRLAVAGPPRDFLGIGAAFGTGLEVLVDAPGGALVAEGLNPLLWVLRGLVPAGAPLRVTLAEPGMPATPDGPFLAATMEPPAGSDPLLRFDSGRILLSNRAGRPVLDLAGLERALALQLVTAQGQPGLWLRQLGPLPPLPAAAPRLDQGDVALLDAQGLVLAWSSAPAPTIRVAYPDAPPAAWDPLALLMAWRPWLVGAAWLAGVLLVAFAFLNPRRDRAG